MWSRTPMAMIIGGFIGGQVYKYSGFVSNEGSFDSKKMTEDHLVIMTFWKSFEQHEKSLC